MNVGRARAIEPFAARSLHSAGVTGFGDARRKFFAAAAVVRLAAVMSAFTIVILAETLLLHASAGGTLLPAEPRF